MLGSRNDLCGLIENIRSDPTGTGAREAGSDSRRSLQDPFRILAGLCHNYLYWKSLRVLGSFGGSFGGSSDAADAPLGAV